MPIVTVGIPCYNSGKYIALAIKSVLNQTFTDFEFIITDDGSSDRTVEIARSFKDPRIKVLSDGENHGISYRLNQQIELAQGKYFCRMDADDIMMPNRLAYQIDYLEAHPDVDVIGGGVVVIDDNNNIIGQRVSSKEKRIDFLAWLNGTAFIHPTVCGRIDFFKQYKYSDTLKGVEDVDLWQRASDDKNMVILPELFNYYREPLIFKLKTYHFRGRQFRNLLQQLYTQKRIKLSQFISRIIGNYVRCLLATSFHMFKLDGILISRRNSRIDNKEIYSQTLINLV